jgi:hypothetical protein
MKDNRLIAEFMEYELEGEVWVATMSKEDDTYLGRHLLFQTSWDWLMPVVEKIFSLGYDYTIKPRHMIIKERMGEIVSECIGQYQSQEEVIYQAVVEFINQYNKNK